MVLEVTSHSNLFTLSQTYVRPSYLCAEHNAGVAGRQVRPAKQTHLTLVYPTSSEKHELYFHSMWKSQLVPPQTFHFVFFLSSSPCGIDSTTLGLNQTVWLPPTGLRYILTVWISVLCACGFKQLAHWRWTHCWGLSLTCCLTKSLSPTSARPQRDLGDDWLMKQDLEWNNTEN